MRKTPNESCLLSPLIIGSRTVVQTKALHQGLPVDALACQRGPTNELSGLRIETRMPAIRKMLNEFPVLSV